MICEDELDPTAPLVRVPEYRDPAQFSYKLSRELTLRAITELAGELLMLHAACLADDHGRAVAFVAPSGMGKSTLVRTLGPRYRYVTDELVAIGSNDVVYPFPKPLSHVVQRTPLRKWDESPTTLGLTAEPGRPKLHGVILLRRQSGVSEPYFEDVPVDETLREVVPQTSSLGALEGGLASLCRVLTLHGVPRRIVYSEARDLRGLVARYFEEPVCNDGLGEHSWGKVPQGVEPAAHELGHPRGASALWVPGGAGNRVLSVMRSNELVQLTLAAGILWEAFANPGTVDRTLGGLVSSGDLPSGRIPEARVIVRELVERGLLVTGRGW